VAADLPVAATAEAEEDALRADAPADRVVVDTLADAGSIQGNAARNRTAFP